LKAIFIALAPGINFRVWTKKGYRAILNKSEADSMHIYILGLLGLFGIVQLSHAQNDETAENSDPTIKAVAATTEQTQGQPATEEHDLIAERFQSQIKEDRESSKTSHLSPINPLSPGGISIADYLEYGMVPVEDLEARLSDNDKKVAESGSKSLGRFYTVYARNSGSAQDGGGNASGTSEDNEAYEFTTDEDEDEDEADDEREDDDSEEADL